MVVIINSGAAEAIYGVVVIEEKYSNNEISLGVLLRRKRRI
jgi:hypothetical protein